jgi:glucose-6-phosphate 1-dehydrogenase
MIICSLTFCFCSVVNDAKESVTILVVGASGDLAKRKTYPALLALYKASLLPSVTIIWGFARTEMTHYGFRHHLKPFLNDADECVVDQFLSICNYRPGSSYGDWESMDSILKASPSRNLVVYLATPPNVFAQSAAVLKKTLTLTPTNGFVRLVLEKPFGSDTESCETLLRTLNNQEWLEQQLYRIDHYLGKEMVQNILTLRQQNRWLNSLWNKDAVKSVHIICKESFGTDGRGGYFDRYGIIRDIFQNHLLQLLTLVAMDMPEKSCATKLRNAKLEILRKIPVINLEDCLFGQYEGYKDDSSIENRDTVTPTYACIRTWVHNETWRNVPFVLEAGKALNDRLCEIRLHFRGVKNGQPNSLVLRLQPVPTIFLTANVKTPGFSYNPVSARMQVDYGQALMPDAYTRLLLDVLRGKQANFVRDDELLASWKIFTPILNQTEQLNIVPEPYMRGSTGPDKRVEFLRSVGAIPSWSPPPSAL